MCHRCAGHLVKTDDEILCVVCGWRGYPTPRLYRLGPRDRAQRRARARRVALESSARGACHTCGDAAVTAKHCQLHREMNNAAARARLQVRRAAGLCRYCGRATVTRDYCEPHRRHHNAQRQPRQAAAAGLGDAASAVTPSNVALVESGPKRRCTGDVARFSERGF